ncbi:ABC transporter ATP-binding protein [Culicoidibacter larvae]|uniref:ABC transporter ATP-binding protein n=1 Tax=Culicoidibacter larvae TaxID=2579976 RepID=A0A5R8QA05_9FIRM|nr:ABC transporter ATP-binding protein [Culicoidibacter larvae]TLG72479.1 ABC transporter ATP-binding protein [Culicoidibacter larvae]
MQNIVHVENIKKIYGSKGGSQVVALNGVSFDIAKGEFVGIMGASGSGKTTMLNAVSTIDKPTSGVIEIAGTNITKMNNNQIADFRADQLGFIFQDFNLLENLTVYENIALPLSLQGVKNKQAKVQVKKVAELLGIADLLTKYPVELSGGQKQRTAAARALVHQPSLILADEPTGALDSKSAKNLLETMQSLNEVYDVTIMMVTHDAFSASYCNRILFIQDGKIYRELHNRSSRAEFYQEILSVLAQVHIDDEPINAGARANFAQPEM